MEKQEQEKQQQIQQEQQLNQQQMQQQESQENGMVQWNDVKGNSGKATTAIIILLLVIIIAGGAFIFMKKDVLFSTKEDNKEVEKNTTKEVDDDEKDDDEVEEIKDIDLTKSLNTTNANYSHLNAEGQKPGITIKINDDKRSVTVTYDTHAQSAISGVTQSTSAGEGYSNEIKGFTKNIKSTFIGRLGQDLTGTVLFFITEDNKIQFVRLFNRETDSHGNLYWTTYWAYGDDKIKILNVDNVDGTVKMYSASTHAEMASGAITTLAAKADGSFYDLGVILN